MADDSEVQQVEMELEQVDHAHEHDDYEKDYLECADCTLLAYPYYVHAVVKLEVSHP
jgi:hypothetical protein